MKINGNAKKWLRPPAAGEYLGGVSTSTLAKWRLIGNGPKFSKANRIIFYSVEDLDDFLSARCRLSTSDSGQEARQ